MTNSIGNQMNKYIAAGSLILLGLATPMTHADTIGEIVMRQNELARMDHTIEKNERLIEIQEQANEFVELSQPKPKPTNDDSKVVQEQYFGQRPAGMNGAQPVPPEKTPEERRRDRILGLLDGAAVSEVFLPPNATTENEFIAVIDMGDEAREVRIGSSIEGWTVTAVELNKVQFHNREFGKQRTVYQAR